MATVDKAFRIKNGLVVEGSSATVNGSNVLTEASTEFLQDTTAAMFTGGTQTGITFTYNDSTGVIDAAVSSTPTFADRIIFEGNTPDDYELTLLAPEPASDITVTLPNATDTLVGKATTDTFTNKTFDTASTGNVLRINGNQITSYVGSGGNVVLSTSPTITTPYIASGLNINGSTTGTTQIVAASTASGVLTLPAATGTVALTSDIPSLTGYVTETGTQTLSNKTISGTSNTLTNIANTSLTNSSVTVNGSAISLGGSATITAANPNALTIGTGLSGTSYDGSSAVTVAIDSTVATTSGSQTLTNKTISSTSNTISVTSGNVTDFTEASVDAVAAAIAAGTQTNITITYDDNAGTLSFNASGGVASVSGTANQITASTSTGAVTLSLPSSVTFPGTVTLNADPSQPLQAATKQYVDDVAQGLHIHPSSVTATTSNLTATYSNGTSGVGATLTNSGTQAALVIDGITLNTNDRVLVKNQTSQLQNGIYTVTDTGSVSTNWVLTRATDMDQSAEVDGGDFTFVTGGTVNDNTGWVQTSTGVTIGTDAIVWQQFSGAGTYLAGNGLTLTGNIFTIDTSITADLNSVQSLSNKTLTSPVLTTPSISGLLVLDNNIVIEGTNDTHETTLTFTDPTQDNTITFKDATGTVAFTSDIETAIDGFGNAVTSTTGISVSYASTSNILTIGNTGVTSIAGTADQVSANTSTESVTLSLPQSIASTSSPTFAGLSVGSGSLTAGSIILTDALIGTATTSLSDTSATVVDSWSATNYKSAKYIVQMRDGNDIEVLEVLVTIDGNNNVYLTEYADIQSNAQIGTTDADYDSGNVRLKVTATGTTTVKVHKTLIEA